MATSFSVKTIEFPSIAGVDQDGIQIDLFTPNETGLYRISLYTEEAILGQLPNIGGVQYFYTDSSGNQSFLVAPIAQAAGASSTNFFPSLLLHLVEENPVKYYFSGISSNVFNAYFVIEKLG